jgi:hypothetical protein
MDPVAGFFKQFRFVFFNRAVEHSRPRTRPWLSSSLMRRILRVTLSCISPCFAVGYLYAPASFSSSDLLRSTVYPPVFCIHNLHSAGSPSPPPCLPIPTSAHASTYLRNLYRVYLGQYTYLFVLLASASTH